MITHALDAQPRVRLTILPTPLHEARRLRDALGGPRSCPRILVKRDDLTDHALGGNKARKLEFILADALNERATTLITTGAVQSNHARMTAAAAKRAALDAILVLTSNDPNPPRQGNLLLDHILGAEVHFVPEAPPDAATNEAEVAKIEEVMYRVRARGGDPYLVELGGSCAIGALGYVQATRELVAQLREIGAEPSRLYYASGSRGTQAGLELGARLFSVSYRCQGIAVSGGEEQKAQKAARIIGEAAALLGTQVRVDVADLLTDQRYYGAGYGVVTPAVIEAIALMARSEGVFLDPVYSAKAMAGLIDHIRTGQLRPDQTVVFLHTGGVPGLFAKATDLVGSY
jgi:D-cysteine desulfhydrase family pyridoxal phosphate-dependent enzyme